jgi:2-polyprenyl-6-methoxyphenol hydroxylase-like FAD-dependent oxidoreductase
MKAIIIGGGIGGLSAALALERVGIRRHVFEQADELREVDAGLTVWANALRALEQLGVSQRALSVSSKVDHFEARTSTGKTLARTSYFNLERKLGGQGACQAIEDALFLAASLAGYSQVQTALRYYEQARQPRTAAITQDSWRLGRICQWENPFGCWLRNRLTSWTPGAVSLRLIENRVNYELPRLRGRGCA